jgi:hypothetical protein
MPQRPAPRRLPAGFVVPGLVRRICSCHAGPEGSVNRHDVAVFGEIKHGTGQLARARPTVVSEPPDR